MVHAQAVLHGRLSQDESEAPAPLRENLHGAVEHPRSWHRRPDALVGSGDAELKDHLK